ncbi:vanadium-dependent haloperoxidase [Xanthocytophaga flava]|uniref:vanadium-dependent haloperoxidase n=1 Tax=Xanthocytophaga flava TaxID=3048013 RepID=UPI0028D4D489|nr:vanadium-dependent haloperoxidase [Xanthocytophaga flavus]MDJ1466547.1 vanadium-dependent haloperoxidase [Xanthocytophaga flavus]
MKKNTHLSFIKTLAVALLFLVSNACDKSLDTSDIKAYSASTTDPNGGNWKTFVIADGEEVAVAEPTDASSDAYKAELQSLKTLQGTLTGSQKNTVQYWGGGAVLRWNEIARELAAQYNVPPNYNPDGTYPVPDPTKPTELPRFPFANPPYTARAFALLSVAQYDALVATWNYKFKYNRQAPSKNDSSIETLLPLSDLPSYPSEDAVIAAASREVLKRLFPGEAEKIIQKAEEHKNSRLWAGTNVQSDIDAGEALGKAIGEMVMSKIAGKDGMSGANAQANFHLMREDATARGITAQWTSRDIPARPPMLPFYGNVKTWNFDEATKVSLRPEAPYALNSAEFKKDLDELRNLSKNRTREQTRIAAYWADGVGSYTPPGHWNRKAAALIYDSKFNELRAARTMALLNTAVMDAGVCCWDTKFYYLTQRPSEVDPSVKTSTGIPNFPSYTSGHSTFSGAAATVLSYIFPDKEQELQTMATEASVSRIYGGIHYRIDCEVGLRCGKRIGEYAVNRGKSDGSGL